MSGEFVGNFQCRIHDGGQGGSKHGFYGYIGHKSGPGGPKCGRDQER